MQRLLAHLALLVVAVIYGCNYCGQGPDARFGGPQWVHCVARYRRWRTLLVGARSDARPRYLGVHRTQRFLAAARLWCHGVAANQLLFFNG